MGEPARLWYQAAEELGPGAGEQAVGARYRELMRAAGLLLAPGDPGYDPALRTLPCGYPGPPVPAEQWCDLFDMPASGCAHCRGIKPEPEPARGGIGRAFTARYAGNCTACGDRFSEGDAIRADGSGHGYLHDGCEA